jgi:hypothetical protein
LIFLFLILKGFTEYIEFDSNVGLFFGYRAIKGVKTEYAIKGCLNYSKIFGEISNQAFYNYVSNLIITLFSQRNKKLPAYIRLNIAIDSKKNPYFDTLKNITYPGTKGFEHEDDLKDVKDTYKTGLKIDLDKNKKKLSLGYYKDKEFDGILCLSSNNLTSNDSCIDEEIVNTCSIYLENNQNVTKMIDCYELGWFKIIILFKL